MLKTALERILDGVVPDNAVVEFNLLSSDEMARLNEDYLQHEGPTDVITFSYVDEERLAIDEEPTVGEIFVCPEVAQLSASELGLPLEEEIILYLIHGILHLSGLDDIEKDDRAAMRQAEIDEMTRLKSSFDLSIPFSIT